MINRQALASMIFLLTVFGYMLSINLLLPVLGDDYHYAFIMGTNQRLQSLEDIVTSQITHYYTWGGRNVSHTIAQFFLLVGKKYFAIFNAGMFVALIILIYLHSKGRDQRMHFDFYVLMLITLFCWFCLPMFNETIVWLTGSCNYLWLAVIRLIFLLPYRYEFLGKPVFERWNPAVITVAMFLLGLISGWTNENTALVMIMAVFAAVVYFYKKKTVKAWTIAGLAGAITGYCFMVLAPGNFVRWATVPAANFWIHNVWGTCKTTLALLTQQWPLIILLVILYRIMKEQVDGQPNLLASLINKFGHRAIYGAAFIGLGLLNHLIMIGSPTFPKRAGFGGAVFLIIGVMSFLQLAEVKQRILTSLGKRTIVALFCVILLPTAALTLDKYHTIYLEDIQRTQYTLECKNNGQTDIILPLFSVKDRSVLSHVYVSDIAADRNFWRNQIYAKYFGLTSVSNPAGRRTKQ